MKARHIFQTRTISRYFEMYLCPYRHLTAAEAWVRVVLSDDILGSLGLLQVEHILLFSRVEGFD